MSQEGSDYTKHSKRMRIYDLEEFKVDLEYNHVFCIAHLPYVDKMNKSTLAKLMTRTEELHDFVTTLGYENLFAASNNKTVDKLLEKLGFVYVGSQDNLNVYVYKELKEIIV